MESLNAYYQPLINNFRVQVRLIDNSKGKGLFASSAFSKRSILFQDKPLACLQSRKQVNYWNDRQNAQAVRRESEVTSSSKQLHLLHAGNYPRPIASCERCCRFVGTLQLQLALLAGQEVPLSSRDGMLVVHDVPFAPPAKSNQLSPIYYHQVTQPS